MRELEYVRRRFMRDLNTMGIDLNSELVLRSYSKTQWGNYDPNTDRISIYVFQEKGCITLIPYSTLFKVLLHEYVHSLEWKSSVWVRLKGVMHDPLFYRIYNHLLDVSVKVGVLSEEQRQCA